MFQKTLLTITAAALTMLLSGCGETDQKSENSAGDVTYGDTRDKRYYTNFLKTDLPLEGVSYVCNTQGTPETKVTTDTGAMVCGAYEAARLYFSNIYLGQISFQSDNAVITPDYFNNSHQVAENDKAINMVTLINSIADISASGQYRKLSNTHFQTLYNSDIELSDPTFIANVEHATGVTMLTKLEAVTIMNTILSGTSIVYSLNSRHEAIRTDNN